MATSRQPSLSDIEELIGRRLADRPTSDAIESLVDA